MKICLSTCLTQELLNTLSSPSQPRLSYQDTHLPVNLVPHLLADVWSK